MNEFDKIVNQIAAAAPPAAEAEAAAVRVREKLFGAVSQGSAEIRGCADYQSLLPAYLRNSLPEARRMLVDDHIRECVNCRRALHEARSGPKVVTMPAVATAPKPTTRRWAIAAAAVIAVGGSTWAMLNVVKPNGPAGSLQMASGMVYQVTSSGSLPIVEGRELAEGEIVRTAQGGRAVVRLFDGSLVEMNERAQLSIHRGWGGTTVQLESGHVIVQAAKQKSGHLYVASADARVAVKGTIFSVNRGVAGSRVAVAEGAVEVEHNGRTESLKPGQQAATDPAIAAGSIEAEFEWSKDGPRYLALLGELNALQAKIAAVPGPGLRYSSKLMQYVGASTGFYLAIPNSGNSLAQSRRVVDDQLKQSPALSEWWNAPKNAAMRTEMNRFLDSLQSLSAAVGPEAVVFGTANGPEMILAEAQPSAAATVAKFVSDTGKAFDFAIVNNILILTQPDKGGSLAKAKALVSAGAAPANAFRDRIAQAYTGGAGYLAAINMEQILAVNVTSKVTGQPTPADLGFANAQYLVLERRELSVNHTENRALLSFKGARTGMPAWLATPGPMNTLSFVSPDAGTAVSVVTKTPQAMVEELFNIARRYEKNFDANLAKFQAETGLQIVNDFAAPLGAEGTFAIDGPMLPVPSWKLILEVNQPQRLQASIEKLITTAIKTNPNAAVKLISEQASGRTFYRITGAGLPFDINYTFVDSYLVAAPNRTLITQAIQTRGSGFSLPRSDKFRSQLVPGSSPNYSAVFYHNLGAMFGPVADQLKDLKGITPAIRQSMLTAKDTPPGVIVAYGESGAIRAATTGQFAGFNLGMLAGALIQRK